MAVLFLVSRILQNYELTMTFFILFFYVAIPLIFLANSRENHDRLVDIGFLKSIQNTLRLPAKPEIEPNMTISTVKTISGFGYKRREEEIEKWADCLETPIMSLKCEGTGEINRTVFSEPQEEFFDGAANNIPSSSSSHGLGSNKPKARKLVTKGMSSESDEDNTTYLRGDLYCNLVWKIVDLMMSNINMESRYMFYLKELCRLEFAANTDSNDDLENFDIIEFEQAQYTKRQKIKSSDGYKNIMKDMVRIGNSRKNAEVELQELKVEFLGTFSQRHDLRKTILSHFCEVSKDQASYKQYLEYLLDLEERLRL